MLPVKLHKIQFKSENAVYKYTTVSWSLAAEVDRNKLKKKINYVEQSLN